MTANSHPVIMDGLTSTQVMTRGITISQDTMPRRMTHIQRNSALLRHRRLPFATRLPPSAFRRLLPAFRHPPPAFRLPPPTARLPPSASAIQHPLWPGARYCAATAHNLGPIKISRRDCAVHKLGAHHTRRDNETRWRWWLAAGSVVGG